jgi:NAD(P)-dependent dehydrogenase (short-subunit alcohol dehydrogenase family)
MRKVWFITGASSGFGRIWARAALERGDMVAGTARDVGMLTDLTATFGDSFLPIQLDVRDRDADVAAVKTAHRHFGRLDVVVTNAAYGQFGMVEELSEREARSQMDANFFGPLWIAQAALPILRGQRSGHIIAVSSDTGNAAQPERGVYTASTLALQGLSDSLAAEVAQFGIRVTFLQPARTGADWIDVAAKHSAVLPAYRTNHRISEDLHGAYPGADGPAAAAAMMTIVDADAPPRQVSVVPSMDYVGAGSVA